MASRIQPAKETITAAIRAVMEHTATWPRGSVLTWHTIEQVCGMSPTGDHWSAFRERLIKTFQRERGITLFHFPPNNGWTLCTEEQTIVAVPLKRGRRAFRQLSKARKGVSSLSDSALSGEQKLAAAEADQVMRQAQSAIRKQVKKALYSPLKWE